MTRCLQKYLGKECLVVALVHFVYLFLVFHLFIIIFFFPVCFERLIFLFAGFGVVSTTYIVSRGSDCTKKCLVPVAKKNISTSFVFFFLLCDNWKNFELGSKNKSKGQHK